MWGGSPAGIFHTLFDVISRCLGFNLFSFNRINDEIVYRFPK